MRRKVYILIVLVIMSFTYGIFVGSLKYPPYNLFNWGYDLLNQEGEDKYNTIGDLYKETNVGLLIDIKDKNDIQEIRTKLIDYIWSGNRFPDSKMPCAVESGINNEYNFRNLKSVDKLVVCMDYGFNSTAYLFNAKNNNNKLIIYHEGHSGSFLTDGEKTINFFLDNGYSVLVFSMPMLGMNNQPLIYFENFGKLKFIHHDQLRLLESAEFSPIKLFVEPVAIGINYLRDDYEEISMVGLSGGGWTTTLYAATDPRISKSYPVASSMPLYLRSDIRKDWGDYEQYLPELYNIANYLELYILGSYGEDRRQLQVLNKYDSCCFSGIDYLTYLGVIKENLSKLGNGSFEVFLDDTHREHKISDIALNEIIKDLKS